MYDITLIKKEYKDVKRIDINVIERLLQSGKQESCRGVVEAYFEGVDYNHMNSTMLRLYITMDIYLASISFCSKLGISNEDFLARFGSIDEMEGKITTQTQIIDYFSEMLEQCIFWRIKYSQEDSKAIIVKARRYIADNYSNDGISLRSVADAINLSPTYFSSLFKKEVGKNFVEYLSEFRIEKAKELLCCTSMQITEIAYKVGFKDYRYFSQIFKKYSGHTPREFQIKTNK